MILRRLGAFLLDTLQVIVFAVAIFLFVYLLILQPHKIKGASMMPNYEDGEYLLTDKVTYRFNQPKRGDIIVFRPPISEDDEFIKRIIGLPGEWVSVKRGKIYINAKLLDESYIPPNFPTNSGRFIQENVAVEIPENEYFVLGDNRLHSSDSRTWGFVPKENITGRAWIIYWPIAKAGTLENVDYSPSL